VEGWFGIGGRGGGVEGGNTAGGGCRGWGGKVGEEGGERGMMARENGRKGE